MKNILAILAVFATLAMVGCASSSTTKSPWAAGNAPSPEAAPGTDASDSFDADDEEELIDVFEDEEPLLANYPEISKVNKEKALAEIEAAKTAEPLPEPDQNRARVLTVNSAMSLIELQCMTPFKAGQRVVIAKDDYKTLYQIVLVETDNRYIAEEVRGVLYTDEMKDYFHLVPADDVVCVEWIDPEDPAAVKAAAEKMKAESNDAESAVDEDEDEDEDDGDDTVSLDDDE